MSAKGTFNNYVIPERGGGGSSKDYIWLMLDYGGVKDEAIARVSHSIAILSVMLILNQVFYKSNGKSLDIMYIVCLFRDLEPWIPY